MLNKVKIFIAGGTKDDTCGAGVLKQHLQDVVKWKNLDIEFEFETITDSKNLREAVNSAIASLTLDVKVGTSMLVYIKHRTWNHITSVQETALDGAITLKAFHTGIISTNDDLIEISKVIFDAIKSKSLQAA